MLTLRTGGLDLTTEVIPSDLESEVNQAFANVQHTLEHAGGKGWAQVYKVRIYAEPLNEEMLELVVRNLRKHCPNHQPLLTVVGVSKLALEGMRIEVEVGAHLGA